MRSAREAVCIAAAGLVLVLAGCGGEDPAEGLASNVDKARNAASVAALQTGLVTVALVEADSPGGAAPAMAAGLQAKDPTNRYTTATPTDAGIIQVVRGDGGPVMLVSRTSAPSDGGAADFVAAWQGGGITMYYVGREPPAYSPSAPTGAGWSSTLPQ